MKAQDLKNSILQLAIQGKLVAQDKNDEPAEVLYAKIQAEKQKLIKEGKIKKDKPLPPITEDEIPFSIPPTWKWVRLGNLGYTQTGTTPPRNHAEYYGEDYPFIKPADIDENGNVNFPKEYLSSKGIQYGRFIKKQSILMICIGSIGRAGIVNFDCSCNQQINVLTPYLACTKYLLYAMSSNNFQMQALSNTSQTTLPILNKSKWDNLILPLPPLEEQKRIVAKIEELEPLINQYDQAEQKLSTLNDKFPKQLKKSILQLAIQGKLVAQDENDESAEVLYAKIQAEKQKLIKEGKIKKDKPLPPITEDEIPFSIPPTWKWVRLGEIGLSRIGLTYHPSDISPKGTIVLRSGNIQNNKLSFSDTVRVNIPIPENLLVRKGDIIICARNGSKTLVGKSALIGELDEAMSFGAFMAIFRCSISPYVKLYLDSPLFKKTLSAVNTVTINQITQQNLNQAILPLPPLEEQHRIVARVATLLEACEKLVH